MKNKVFQILMAICIIAGCQSTNRPSADFISGVYARIFDQEFAKGNDTLYISVFPDETSRYKIEHRATYIPVLDGVKQPKKIISETWLAVYNVNTKQLLEQRKGKIFSFSQANNCLYYGTGKYDKIK